MQQFVENLLAVIDQRIELGRAARLALFAYDSQSTMLTSLRHIYSRDKLAYIFSSHSDVSNRINETSGLYEALTGARSALEGPDSQWRNETSSKQVLILFKYGSVDDDPMYNSTRLLYELMNNFVYVIIVGMTSRFYAEVYQK